MIFGFFISLRWFWSSGSSCQDLQGLCVCLWVLAMANFVCVSFRASQRPAGLLWRSAPRTFCSSMAVVAFMWATLLWEWWWWWLQIAAAGRQHVRKWLWWTMIVKGGAHSCGVLAADFCAWAGVCVPIVCLLCIFLMLYCHLPFLCVLNNHLLVRFITNAHSKCVNVLVQYLLNSLTLLPPFVSFCPNVQMRQIYVFYIKMCDFIWINVS